MADSKLKFPTMSSLRDLSREDLVHQLSDMRKTLAHAQFMHRLARYERTSDLKNLRKTIARMSMLLSEKEQGK